MILYLHGFRSSPHSYKARLFAERLAARGPQAFCCPQLSASPALAIAQAEQIIVRQDPATLCLVGSSLGGYYATWLAERHGLRAVLLNPAVQPPVEVARYVGPSTLFHNGASFAFLPAYLDELRALALPPIQDTRRYFLLAATGDEVLDYRDMLAHYPHARRCLIEGSDHGLSDFADHLDDVLAFCDAA